MKNTFIFGILIAAMFSSGCQWTQIDPGEVGVTTDWGKLTGWTYRSGFHFHAIGIDVFEMSTQVNALDMSGENHINALSRDRLPIGLDVTVQWQINPGQAPSIYENFRDNIDDRLVIPAAREAIRDVMSQFDAEQAVQHRDQLAPRMTTSMRNAMSAVLHRSGMETYAVRVVGIQVRNIRLPPQIQESIQRIQHARNAAQQREQEIRVAQQEAQRAVAEAEGARRVALIAADQQAQVARRHAEGQANSIRIQAEANAEANRAIAESLTPNLLRLRQIDAQRALAEHVQTVVLGGNSSSVIPIPMPNN